MLGLEREILGIVSTLHRSSNVFYRSLNTRDLKEMFQFTLESLVEATGSEYGFIGEVLKSDSGTPYLKTHGITNIAWDDATRDFYETHRAEGLEFHNLDTLFGEVIKTAKSLIANDAPNHPKARGVPPGHPPLNSFLGLPIYNVKGEMVGMVGLANRPDGYSERIALLMSPCTTMMGNVLEAHRTR